MNGITASLRSAVIPEGKILAKPNLNLPGFFYLIPQPFESKLSAVSVSNKKSRLRGI